MRYIRAVGSWGYSRQPQIIQHRVLRHHLDVSQRRDPRIRCIGPEQTFPMAPPALGNRGSWFVVTGRRLGFRLQGHDLVLPCTVRHRFSSSRYLQPPSPFTFHSETPNLLRHISTPDLNHSLVWNPYRFIFQSENPHHIQLNPPPKPQTIKGFIIQSENTALGSCGAQRWRTPPSSPTP